MESPITATTAVESPGAPGHGQLFVRTLTGTHWYPSHLQMKDQGRKLSCKNDRLKQFLCLLVPLLDTYLVEKLLLHFMKKIAVRPSKVQHLKVHTVYSDLYS